MLRYPTTPGTAPGIVIVGLGGAGANILQCFGDSGAEHVRLCIMSPDERLGQQGSNLHFVQLGSGHGGGLGSGGDPEVGARVARESAAEIASLFSGAHLLVMVCGLGGGTGSGAAPVLTRMAREAGLFVVSVLVMPFTFEGQRRREQAERARDDIAPLSDIVLCFENDHMEGLLRERSGVRRLFEETNSLLARATACVPTLAHSPGLINLGLDELAEAMKDCDSRCLFGSGKARGAGRASAAARAALASPLLHQGQGLPELHTLIVHLAGGETMTLDEVRRAMETVRSALPQDKPPRLFFGVSVKPQMEDEMRVSLIAATHARSAEQEPRRGTPAQEQQDTPAPGSPAPSRRLRQGELSSLLAACPPEPLHTSAPRQNTRRRKRIIVPRSYNDLRNML